MVWLAEDRLDKRTSAIFEAVRARALPVKTVSSKELDRVCGGSFHQGVALHASRRIAGGEKDLEDVLSTTPIPLFLVLDGVQDPHNLGACLRSAECSGVDGVILPERNSAPFSSVVHRVSTGAVEYLNLFRIANLARVLGFLNNAGILVVGLDHNAKTQIGDIDLRQSLALVLGNEGSGLRRLTKENCTMLACIPTVGETASLNVSVATGICLYEAHRQRALTD